MELIVHKSIYGLKQDWQRLNGQRERNISAYQTYEVNLMAYKRMLLYGVIEKYRPIYCQIVENGTTVLIAPLCKYLGTNRYCSLGNFNGFQTYDFIYGADLDSGKMNLLIRFLLERLKAEELRLYKLPEDSLVRSACRNGLVYQEMCNENVNIHFDGDAEEWYNRLSKNTRQNLRTSYNRLSKQGMEVRLEIHRGEKINRNLLNQVIGVYCRRHESRYKLKTSPIKCWYLKTLDFSTACQQNYHSNFYSMCWFNGELVAFMSGLVEKNGKSILIPRLAIDDQYSRFSPGMVLINETIKWLAANSSVTDLDLSKGAEKYKLSAGGQIYYTYQMTIRAATEAF